MGLRGCLSDTGGRRAPLTALRLSICHQSSANEGAASAGAYVISTICDSTHEAPVRANALFSFFFGGAGVEENGGREATATYVCTLVLPGSLRLSLVLMERGGGGGGKL